MLQRKANSWLLTVEMLLHSVHVSNIYRTGHLLCMAQQCWSQRKITQIYLMGAFSSSMVPLSTARKIIYCSRLIEGGKTRVLFYAYDVCDFVTRPIIKILANIAATPCYCGTRPCLSS